MKYLLAAVALGFSMCCVAAEPLKFGQTVTVSGTIQSEPIPPDIAPQVKDRTALILHLSTPIAIDRTNSDADASVDYSAVSEIHLIVDHAKVPRQSNNGVRFSVTGRIFSRNTANHARPVVMLVDSLSPAASKKNSRVTESQNVESTGTEHNGVTDW